MKIRLHLVAHLRAHLRAHLLAAVLILIVLGGLWTRTRVQPLGAYDQPFYLGIAYDLLHHDRFTDGFRFAGGGPDRFEFPGERPSGMRFTPLYPTLLAAMASIDPPLRHGIDCLVADRGQAAACPRDAGPMRPLQFLMLAATFWMLWWSAWRCTGRPRIGWIALALALATAPLLLLSVDYLMTEIVSLFLFVSATTLGLRALLSPATRSRWLFAAGLTLGLAVLARPGFSWLAYALLATIAGAAVRRAGAASGWRNAAAFTAGLVLVVMPWVMRNALVMGHAALTFGYGSHTFVQRLSFDSMDWREYRMSFVCWLPDGNGLGSMLSGRHACDRFGWDDHPDSFYAIGIGPMLVSTLKQAGGWSHHMSFLLHAYLLHDPVRQLTWHAMVTIPLALRGLYIDHYWGLLLAPICVAVTIRALIRRDPVGRRFLLLSLPAWFMLAFNAAAAVNQVRYNLMLIVPFSIAGAIAIETLIDRWTPVSPSGSDTATAPAASPSSR